MRFRPRPAGIISLLVLWLVPVAGTLTLPNFR
jgi:hypothetical protein